MCGHEKDPKSLRNIVNMAGGPAQFAIIAFATFVKQWAALQRTWNLNIKNKQSD